MTEDSPPRKSGPFFFILIFVFLAVVIGAAGYLYFGREKAHLIKEKQDELSAIADLKVKQIAAWREELVGDAERIYGNRLLSRSLGEVFGGSRNAAGREDLAVWMASLVENEGFASALLCDSKGVLRLSSGRATGVEPHQSVIIKNAMQTRRIVFTDFHRDETTGDIHLSFTVPIAVEGGGSGRVIGVLLLEVDPRQFLYPLIQEWPTPSETAETLLVRREGGEGVFLNELRHMKGTALTLRFKADQEKLPAAMALRGERGTEEGIDYRGIPVFAAMKQVPNSPWFLVAKVDKEEIYAPIRRRAGYISVIVLVSVLAAGLSVGLLWRQQSIEYYRRQCETENARRRAEASLSATEEQLRLLVDGVRDYAIYMLDPAGNVVSWNQGAERIKGYRPEEIIGRNFSCFYLPEDREAGKPDQHLKSAVSEGRTEEEGWRIRKDGTRFWGNAVITPLLDASGNLRGFSKVTRDITEKKNAEDELRRYTEELRRSNEELQQFAYIASHDLQEPLRMISSYLQLIERRYKDRLDSDATEFIGFAVDGAQRLQDMISGLLAYSRVGTRGGPFQPVDASSALADAISNLKVAIEENDAAVTADPLPTIRADRAQITQVFQNMVSNSIKFRGGESPRIHVSAARQGSEWIFSVKDNGIGIDPKYQDRIFHIFQRLHGREYPGIGLGLTICRRIVERHGGRIWFESDAGSGTTFFFSIPIKEGGGHDSA